MFKYAMLFCSVFMIIPSASTARTNDKLEQFYLLAQAHYGRALVAFENAREELQKFDGSGTIHLGRAIAELQCLRGNLSACLIESRQVGRALGPYRDPLWPARPENPARMSDAWSFVRELSRRTRVDAAARALTAEALGLLENTAGDYYRKKATELAHSRYLEAMQQARSLGGFGASRAWLQAMHLAKMMMDQQAMLNAGQGFRQWIYALRTQGDIPFMLALQADDGKEQTRIVENVLGRDPSAKAQDFEAQNTVKRKPGHSRPRLHALSCGKTYYTNLPKARHQLDELARRVANRHTRRVLNTLSRAAHVIAAGPSHMPRVAGLIK